MWNKQGMWHKNIVENVVAQWEIVALNKNKKVAQKKV